MQVTIAVFERKHLARLELSTLGLGPETRTRTGKSPRKVEEGLTSELRELLRKKPAMDLDCLQLPRGIRLERVRLELNLLGVEEKKKVSGLCPLVVEPRWASESGRVQLVYHPSRQEESFWLHPDIPLEEQAKLYFSKVWADLDEQALGALWSRGKERIRVIAFSADTRSLLDDLPEDRPAPWHFVGTDPARKKKKAARAHKVLPSIAMNLTELSAQGSLSTGLSRGSHRRELGLLLGASKRQPVLVVGAPGSGKTTLIHQWLRDAIEADGYFIHRNLDRVREAWLVSGKRLISGMSHLGQWEQRCLDLLDDARKERVVLVVEDLHHFGRIGRSQGSDRNLADLFRGPIARREIVVVGECTPEQLRKLEEDAPSFASLFTPLNLPESTRADTFRLMLHEMRELELHHHVRISPYALRTLVDLGASLLISRALPGKALDLLRELARANAGRPDAPVPVSSSDAITLLSKKTGVPEVLLRTEEKLSAKDLEVELSRQVIGQHEAVAAAVNLILRIKAGATDEKRPYGVYLFTGPTGTGKTELAKCIAEYLYGSASRLLRFDMSELSGADAPARLIGHRWAPEGLLTRHVQQQPFSVVLLDEIEKAHPAVLNLLLQLFEDGRLTDAAGNTAYFAHTVVIMTSNLGGRARPAVGFGDSHDAVLSDIAKAVRGFFPPELFNRIDRIVPFRPLTEEVAALVAEKEIEKLLVRRGLTERNIFVSTRPGVTRRIAALAFKAEDGARSIKRYLEDTIGALLTAAIAGGSPAAIQIFSIHERGKDFGLDRVALDEIEPPRAVWHVDALLRLPPNLLADHVRSALGLVALVDQGEQLGVLSARIRHHLSQHNLGESGHAEEIFTLESMRMALAGFRNRIEEVLSAGDREAHYERLEMQRFGRVDISSGSGWSYTEQRIRLFDRREMPTMPRLRKSEMLECIAEAHFLRRALGKVDEPGQHAIFIELLRGGRLEQGARFERAEPGLLEWLVESYVSARGEVESSAIRLENGEVHELRGAPHLEPEKTLAPHVVLKVIGLCVRDFFELEAGSHVRHSISLGAEIVRVRVVAAAPGETPAGVLRDHGDRLAAFERAKLAAAGADVPPNPGALPPVVRKVRFDAPKRPGALAPIEIEDYAVGWAEQREVRSLSEGLATLWLLKRSRGDAGEAQ